MKKLFEWLLEGLRYERGEKKVMIKFTSFFSTIFYYTILRLTPISLITQVWNSLKKYGSTLKAKRIYK